MTTSHRGGGQGRSGSTEEELHRALRIAAAEADKSMRSTARDILSQVLLGGAAKKPKGRGAK